MTVYSKYARTLSFENFSNQCLVENMRRAELLAQKMDEEQVIWIKPDQFEGTESEKGFYFPAPNYETYEILAAGWQRLGVADEVGELRKVYWWQRAFKKKGADMKSKSLAGSRGAVEDAASLYLYLLPLPHTCACHLHRAFLRSFVLRESDTSCKKLFYTLLHHKHFAHSGVIGTWGRRRSGFVGEKGSGMFQPKIEEHIKKGKGGLVRNVYKNFFWRPLY